MNEVRRACWSLANPALYFLVRLSSGDRRAVAFGAGSCDASPPRDRQETEFHHPVP
jgi:hypothetical protein